MGAPFCTLCAFSALLLIIPFYQWDFLFALYMPFVPLALYQDFPHICMEALFLPLVYLFSSLLSVEFALHIHGSMGLFKRRRSAENTLISNLNPILFFYGRIKLKFVVRDSNFRPLNSSLDSIKYA